MAEDTTPKQLPVPPIGGDRASWIRFAIQVALLLAGIYLGVGAKEEVKEVKEVQTQMQMKLDAK